LWKSAFSLEKSGDENSQDHSSGASFLFSAKQRQAIADSIGDPTELPNFFPKHKLHTDIESMLQSQRRCAVAFCRNHVRFFIVLSAEIFLPQRAPDSATGFIEIYRPSS
jgi:hypothetical protein